MKWVEPRLPVGPSSATPSPFRGPHGLGLKAPPPGYRAGETVLTVPISLWGHVFSMMALVKAEQEAPAFYAALRSLDDATSSTRAVTTEAGLAAPMALATHLGLALLNDTDPNHPYARFLYECSAAPHPLLLPSPTLQTLFQASPVVPELAKRQRVYASIHRRLFSQQQDSPLPFPIFLWAISRVLSRGLSAVGEHFHITLCPFMDLLNHSNDPNCEYEVGAGPGRKDIVVRATREIRCVLGAWVYGTAGALIWMASKNMRSHKYTHTHTRTRPDEELFISYGDDKDNHRLLMTYGFVDRQNRNRLRITVAAAAAAGEEDKLTVANARQRALLQRLGTNPSVIARPMIPWPLLVVGEGFGSLAQGLAARLVLAAPSFAAVATETVSSDKQGAALADGILVAGSRTVEAARVLDVARHALDAQLRAYGTSVEEDEAALEEVEGKKGMGMQPSALLLRIEEKKLLQEAIAWIREKAGR